MVTAIQFAVRSSAGGTQHSSVAGEGQSNFIQVGSGDSVSLNLSRSSIVAYEQQGGDLVIKLVDGRSIVLAGYFNEAPGDTNHLYLSSEGEIVEVFVQETGNGVLFADYGPVSGWSKWSPLDDLRYTTADGVSEVLVASNEPAGMAPLVPGLLGLGGVGGAAAIIGGAVVVGGLHGGGGTKRTPPTVDAQPVTTVTTNTEDGSLHVSGTGQSGETVAVTIGTVTVTTTIGTDGKWAVTVPETGLPADGSYTATVVVTPSTGTPDTLTGPNFIIDLTPPAVSVVDGTKSTGDIENLVEYQDGVTITGQGEAGATIRVQIGTATQTTTVAANGSWSVTFTQSQVAAGEYEVPVTVTATDPLGNRTVITDTLVIDTVPHPIAFNPVTADNAVNLVESQAGLTVTGTSTAGATLTVTLQGVVQTTTVGADGRWSVTYAPGTLPGGEYTATLTATTVDVAGNTSSATHSFVVDTLTSVAFTGQVAGDNIVNATEAAGAIILTGTAQAGSTVSVAWNGTTLPATVGANGTWSVSFPGAAGGTYSSTATVTATDAYGNTATATRTIQVDTETSVAVNPGQAGGDNILSGSEATSGLQLTGTAEAGATVRVTFEGITRTVTAGANGTWTANWTAAEVRPGSYASTVQVSASDAAGNTASTSYQINVDTEVNPFQRSTLSTGSDQIVNAVEAAAGLTVTGIVEAGSTVIVRFGSGQSRTATVGADGKWTLTIPAGDIPAGENNVTLTATATDRVGNTSTLTETVRVDTTVVNFAMTSGRIGGDGILNASEVAAGLTLTGTSEVGATVVVRLASGASRTVTVGADGNWSATFAAADLPRGEATSAVTVTATDIAGNTSSLSQNFAVDTVAPANPWITNDAGTGNQISGIAIDARAGDVDYFTVAANGAVAEVTPQVKFTSDVNVDGQTVPSDWAFFPTPVHDGTYLVIRDQDAAGNESSTLYIRNTTGEVTVDLNRSGLGQFDFGTIDLTAADANLTLTEAQILRLAGADKQLTISGDTDDQVNLVGGTYTGTTQVVNGETLKLYLVGSAGASVLIDDDITVNTSGV